MGFSVKGQIPDVSENYLTVKSAAKYSGYSEQYLRRLLRGGNLSAIKIGQLWLIEQVEFTSYLKEAIKSLDKRFGRQSTISTN